MEGISKGELTELFKKFYDDAFMRVDQLETLLIEACKELDPWLPIDKNTPKDRRLLLKFIDGYVSVNDLDHITGLVVTHYKELPPDPKD